jgi:hypothetical protein
VGDPAFAAIFNQMEFVGDDGGRDEFFGETRDGGCGVGRKGAEHDAEGAGVVFGEMLEGLVVDFAVAGFGHGRDCGASAAGARDGRRRRNPGNMT